MNHPFRSDIASVTTKWLCGSLGLLFFFWLPVARAQDIKGAKNPLSRLLDIFPQSTESAESVVTYQVKQIVRLSEIDPGAKSIRMWISIPSDEINQRLLNLSIDSAPGPWRFTQDSDHRGTFLAVQITDPRTGHVDVTLSFSLRRYPVHVALVASQAGSMDESLQAMMAEHLILDAPHMEVTEEFKAIADKVCGGETNIAIQAKLLLMHVASTVDHYSYTKDPSMPTCGIGDASVCKKQGGGCCTDLNSYFITLARARGIPARLNMGYRLLEKNVGKMVDAGYRCWVEYFVPNYGWVSADVVEADTPGGLGHERWLSGLTSRRIWLNQGREFHFGNDISVGRVNNMTIGYAEVDGKPVRLLPEGELKPQLTRKIEFVEANDPVDSKIDSRTR